MGDTERRARREAREEIRVHLEMRVEDLVRDEGLPEEEAWARARAEFGDVEEAERFMARRQVRRARRERRAWRRGAALRDLRLALRSLRRRPMLPVVVVLTLALGIGANTAVYSLVDTLAFRPLPFHDGDRLVRMRDATVRPDGEPWLYNTSARSYDVLRESGVFASITAQRYRLLHLTGAGEEPVSVVGIGVSRDWVETLGVAPVLGRDFTPEEESAGRHARVVLLGHALWQRRYGGDASAVGSTVTLDGEPFTVVGVMPPRFNYPYGSELWIPDDFDPSDASSGPNVAARLLPGEDLASTQRALDVVSERAAAAYPDTHRAIRFVAVPQRVDLLGNQPRFGWVLLAAVGFLLLIACANMANLLLARAVSTRRERAVHTALGASRGDHARRLLLENLTMALVGGALGVGIASLLLHPMAALSIPASSSLGAFFTDLRLDGRVLGFALAATGITSLLFGVAPALHMLRTDPMSALRDGGRSGDGAGATRRALVAAEVALSVVLLAGATLLVRDYARLQATDPGYATQDRIVASLTFPDAGARDPQTTYRFMEEVAARVAAQPGVAGVTWVNHLPVTDGSVTRAITAEGGPASERNELVLANLRGIGPGYFTTMGMRLLRGRAPTEAEIGDRDPVVVISGAAAEHYWPGEDPIGRRVRFGLETASSQWLRVVGVVAQAREEWELADTWYVPATMSAPERLYMVVHTDGPVAGVARAIRPAVWAVDPDQPTERVVAFGDLVGETYTSERMGPLVVGSFAGVGLLLAVLGIYGVVSYTVRRSTRELGIRMALGAGAAGVRAMVLRRAAKLVGTGLVVGVVGAATVTRGLASFLTGRGRAAVHTLAEGGRLGPADYVLVVVILGGVALLACWLPARRAARLEPATVLREE